MLVSSPRVRASLRAIAGKIAPNGFDREDLYQEMLIHLWRCERAKPGQTLSWYLQSCKFYGLDYLKRGRSVDGKRRADCYVFSMDDETEDDVPRHVPTNGSDFRDQLFVSDALSLLKERLTGSQLTLLEALAGGATVSEVSRRLGCSHQYVSKQRKKIAQVLQKVLV